MGKYVLAYRGGTMAATEAEQAAAMQQWIGWFGELGAAVVDGGNPFGASVLVGADGGVSAAGASALTGYSIVTADSVDAAATLAKGCPVLGSGGSVEVYEALDM